MAKSYVFSIPIMGTPEAQYVTMHALSFHDRHGESETRLDHIIKMHTRFTLVLFHFFCRCIVGERVSRGERFILISFSPPKSIALLRAFFLSPSRLLFIDRLKDK